MRVKGILYEYTMEGIFRIYASPHGKVHCQASIMQVPGSLLDFRSF